MPSVLRVLLLWLLLVPTAALAQRWEYLEPSPGGLDVTAPFPRAEIVTDDAIATLVWLPADSAWRLFVLHTGWDPDPTRRVVVRYSGDREETATVTAETVTQNDRGNTDLRFDLPDGFLDHLRAGSMLEISRATRPLEIPLTGSAGAIDALLSAREAGADELAALEKAARADAASCDSLAAWAGDAGAAAPPVAWDALDAEAAMKACFSAKTAFPDEPRYLFQLGRATARAGLAGATVWLRQAAEAGYGAAADYLAEGEG